MLLFASIAMPQQLKDTVPLVGFNEQDASLVNHGCLPTGYTLRGSTHWADPFPPPLHFSTAGLVPDLPEVECTENPARIVERSIEWEPVGAYRSYFIRFLVAIDLDGVGRYDIGGVGPCWKTYRGLAHYRKQRYPGDISEVFCFALGNKHYDAEAELSKVIDDASVCRTVFLDKYGIEGEYREAWYNYDDPICKTP